MKYRVRFKLVYDGKTDEYLTKEFSALNNKAALEACEDFRLQDAYERFCRRAGDLRSTVVSIIPTGLFRIRQREIVTRVTRLKKRS